MADFRRVVTAFAVLVLLTGLAVSANAQAFSCNASAAVPPLLRAEGLTELTGDIVINCSGGTPLAPGAPIPTASFTVFVGQTVITSRSKEPLLLINDLVTDATTTPATTAVNVGSNFFTGTVSGNSVTFTNIPVLPPGSNLVYRITNVRVNASNIGGGPGGTPGQVNAFISISGSTSVPITNPAPIVGFVKSGLSFDLKGATAAGAVGKASTGFSFQQCNAVVSSVQGYLAFTENFGSAFKPKGDGTQTTPGAIYNTETGLTIGPNAASLVATSGTLLRATFSNIPSGTTVYVSNTNANATATLAASAVTSETTLTAASTTGSVTAGGFTMIPVTISSTGTGIAVWQVTAADPNVVDELDFAVAFATTPSPGANSPATGVQGTVAGSFAPAPPTIDATAAAKASDTLPVPRFVDSNIVKNLVTFTICQTRLLFPYAVNTSLFDTGIAITNTSKDPFGTVPQAGTCTLNFYGNNAPASSLTTDSIGASTTLGPVYAATLLSIAPGFQGYIIATCNFQYGHGFAFVSDIGAHNLAMGYLALIIPDTRVATEMLNQ